MPMPFCGAAEEEDADGTFFKEAPYPAFSTAWIMAAAFVLSSSYSTVILLDNKLTAAWDTPGTPATLFCTWAEQAEQVIPVTSNFSFFMRHSFHLPTPQGRI